MYTIRSSWKDWISIIRVLMANRVMSRSACTLVSTCSPTCIRVSSASAVIHDILRTTRAYRLFPSSRDLLHLEWLIPWLEKEACNTKVLQFKSSLFTFERIRSIGGNIRAKFFSWIVPELNRKLFDTYYYLAGHVGVILAESRVPNRQVDDLFGPELFYGLSSSLLICTYQLLSFLSKLVHGRSLIFK